jgi:hypothetical protein
VCIRTLIVSFSYLLNHLFTYSHISNSLIHSFILSFIHSFILSFIHSFILSFIHLFILSFIHLFSHSFVYSLIHSFILSFIHSFILSFIHSFILSFIHLFSHSFIYLFSHSFIYSLIHSFIYSLIHSYAHIDTTSNIFSHSLSSSLFLSVTSLHLHLSHNFLTILIIKDLKEFGRTWKKLFSSINSCNFPRILAKSHHF